MDIQIFIPCSDSSGTYAIEHTARGDYDDAGILLMVRSLVEANRALVHSGVTFHGAVVLERNGPLTARTNTRAYCSPNPLHVVTNPELRGLAQGATRGRFVELWAQRGVLAGAPDVLKIRNAVMDADLFPLWKQAALSLSTTGPLWTLRFPLFQAWTRSLQGLGAVSIDDAGNVQETGANGPYTPTYAVYAWKLHMLHLARASHAEAFRSNLVRNLKAAQDAARQYTAIMESFDGNWADNHTPTTAPGYVSMFENALFASSCWYAIARRMGYSNIPPAPSRAYGSGIDGAGRYGYADAGQATRLHRRAPLVKGICERLYACHRVLEDAYTELHYTPQNRTVKDVVYQGRASWYITEEESSGQWKRRFRATDWPETTIFDDWFTGAIHTRCQEQNRLLGVWQESGGASFGARYFELFPAISGAIFETLALLTLLPCVFEATASGHHKTH